MMNKILAFIRNRWVVVADQHSNTYTNADWATITSFQPPTKQIFYLDRNMQRTIQTFRESQKERMRLREIHTHTHKHTLLYTYTRSYTSINFRLLESRNKSMCAVFITFEQLHAAAASSQQMATTNTRICDHSFSLYQSSCHGSISISWICFFFGFVLLPCTFLFFQFIFVEQRSFSSAIDRFGRLFTCARWLKFLQCIVLFALLSSFFFASF